MEHSNDLNCPVIDLAPCEALAIPTSKDLHALIPVVADNAYAYRICAAKQAALVVCIDRYEQQK